jgi:di/tricarboxylate transporter
VAQYGDAPQTSGSSKADEHQLMQVLVAPRSQFVGKTIADINFLKTLGVVVVGLWRREGWMRQEISQVPLLEGDALVVRGTAQSFAGLADHHGFLMMVAFPGQERRRHRAPVALSIIGMTVAVAASGLLPAHIAFLAGAVALVVTGCVGVERAYREIDVRIFVMIAGVIPLGLAMEKSGTAAYFATHLQQLTAEWSSIAVLLALFWSAALVTQVLSDAATVVLLGPIALALALGLELPPQPFLVCTALGAVTAFLTPIGHHGNLLILSPGQYTFGDFLRVGVPLTVLISAVSVWTAQWLWLGGPLLPFAW